MGEVGRNDPCPCGSGKKYKNCCLGKAPPTARRKRMVVPILLVLIGIAAGAYLGVTKENVGLGLATGAGFIILAGVVVSFRDPPPPSGKGGDSAAINFGK